MSQINVKLIFIVLKCKFLLVKRTFKSIMNMLATDFIVYYKHCINIYFNEEVMEL